MDRSVQAKSSGTRAAVSSLSKTAGGSKSGQAARSRPPVRIMARSGARILAGSGEMGARIAAFDWASTTLDPFSRWPCSVRSAVSICVRSPTPIVLTFGREHPLIHNDACIPLMGDKLPRRTLCCRAIECWPELWHIAAPVLDNVLETGTARWTDDLRVDLNRRSSGEENFSTFFCAPIQTESGKVVGCMAAINDTTERVVGERRLRTLRNLAACTRLADSGPAGASRHLHVGSGKDEVSNVVVAIGDSGPGFPSGDAERIFDAFFSTKTGASGMGLSISRSIVEAHGGRLWADSGEGRGATFRFTIPRDA